jgi:glycosyltransferase involved in cell wall biosynthesis
VPAARLAHTPVIISSRRDLANWWWYTPQKRKILRRVQSLSTSVLANSEAVRDFLVKDDGFRADRIRVIRNAVDLGRFTRIPPDRERLFPGLGRDDKLVIIVANMNSLAKGHDHLIQAARIVCSLLPKTRFVLVGDGELRGRFEQQVRDLGLHQNFLFLGQRRDVPELLRCCDVSVLPSTGEGLPNVVLEAMAAGLPVVATRVGGTTEIIEDEQSGLLVPPGDSDALAHVILRLFQDPHLARELAHAGQERVRTQFNFDRLLANLEGFYRELLDAKRLVPNR